MALPEICYSKKKQLILDEKDGHYYQFGNSSRTKPEKKLLYLICAQDIRK